MIRMLQLWKHDEYGSLAEVTIGAETVEVPFWYSVTAQMSGHAEFDAFLYSQASLKMGNRAAAIALLTPYAQGTITDETLEYERNGTMYSFDYKKDRRNLAAKLIDQIQSNA